MTDVAPARACSFTDLVEWRQLGACTIASLAAPSERPMSIGEALLLLVAGATGRFPLDPVRLMKGAFIVSQRGRNEWRALFNFQAYDYGPFDRSVYEARDSLVDEGLLEVIPGRYDSYRLTARGEGRVAELVHAFGDDARWVQSIGRYVTSKSFAGLLAEIYDAYPDYAVRSLHRR